MSKETRSTIQKTKSKKSKEASKRKRSRRVTFHRRDLKFYAGAEWDKNIDWDEAKVREPKQQIFKRVFKRLNPKSPNRFSHWYEVIKFKPSLRVWDDNDDVIIDLTIQEARRFLAEVLEIARGQGFDLPDSLIELETYDRSKSNARLGFEGLEWLQKYKTDPQLALFRSKD
jgi:hypothetical protein